MEKFHLIHETSCENVQQILLNRYLFTSSKTQNMRSVVGGQGGSNRRIAIDPRVSLHDSKFMEKYDEVDGVYFRLHPKLHHMTDTYFDCIMVFSHKLLQDFDFLLNTEESFGFNIDEEGVVGTSPFTGKPGVTVSDYRNLKAVFDLMTDYDSTEVLIREDVPVNYLLCVMFKKIPLSGVVNLLDRDGIEYFVL